MNIVNKSFVSIDEIRSKLNGGAGQVAEKTGSDSGKSFDRVLLDKADQIKFSRHAESKTGRCSGAGDGKRNDRIPGDGR